MASTATQDTGSRTGRKSADDGTAREDLAKNVYSFDDLSGYSAGERLTIRLLDLFFYCLVNLICCTVRWEVRGSDHLESIVASGHRTIFTFWHNCIFGATWAWRRRGIVVMSSRSRDGEYVARFIKRFGYGTARGSATRGAGRALAEMARCLSHGIDTAFTIDGPRGPAFVAKPGAVTLAKHTGQAILPFHVTSNRFISLPSWDRLQIPIPFTKAITLVGAPIYVCSNSNGDDINRYQSLLQSSLEQLRDDGERWRKNGGSLPH